MKLSHVAAAYDRVNILEWMDDEQIRGLDATDRKGRTVLDVARSSQAA
jgi:hypothetical protein